MIFALLGLGLISFLIWKSRKKKQEKPWVKPEVLGFSLDGDEKFMLPTLEAAEKVKTIEKVYKHYTDGSKYDLSPPQYPVTGTLYACSGFIDTRLIRPTTSYQKLASSIGNSALEIQTKKEEAEFNSINTKLGQTTKEIILNDTVCLPF